MTASFLSLSLLCEWQDEPSQTVSLLPAVNRAGRGRPSQNLAVINGIPG
jgi:hypothetical protein